MNKKYIITLVSIVLLQHVCSAMEEPIDPRQKECDEKITQHEKKIQLSYSPQLVEKLIALNILPCVLASEIAQYAFPTPGWFLPYIDLTSNDYQRRNATALKGKEEIEIIGKQGGQLVAYNFQLNNVTKQMKDKCPPDWDKSAIIADLQKSFGVSYDNLDCDPFDRSYGIHNLPEVTSSSANMLYHIVSKLKSLEPYNSPAVRAGQEVSRIYVHGLTPQEFAQACIARHIQLTKKVSQLEPPIFESITPTYGDYLNKIVYDFPHDLINKLAADTTGTLMPLCYEGGTLEECIQHRHRDARNFLYYDAIPNGLTFYQALGLPFGFEWAD